MNAVIETQGLTRRFRKTVCRQGSLAGGPGRQHLRPAGPQRRRQDHTHQDGHEHGPALGGQSHDSGNRFAPLGTAPVGNGSATSPKTRSCRNG